MDVEAYSQCSIRFTPKDKKDGSKDYSDRSLVELRLDKYGSYFLQALDIENKKKKIFQIKIEASDIYKIGSSVNVADQVRSEDGTYFLNLKPESRCHFHKQLEQMLLKLNSGEPPETKSGNTSGKESSTRSQRPKNVEEENDILLDIHRLNQHIQRGEADMAVDIVEKLEEKGVRLHAEKCEASSNIEPFSIRVQIDGLNRDTTKKAKVYSIQVYPSTKVHELKVLFEYAYGFPLASQYFFVNGHLAYAQSTMENLEVQKNSLFILFSTSDVSKEN